MSKLFFYTICLLFASAAIFQIDAGCSKKPDTAPSPPPPKKSCPSQCSNIIDAKTLLEQIKANQEKEGKPNQTQCPNIIQAQDEPIHSTSDDSFPETKCRACHLRLAPDNQSVIVKCFKCSESDPSEAPAGSDDKKIYIV